MTVIALTASSGLNQTIDMIHDDHALQDPLLLAALHEGANGGGGSKDVFHRMASLWLRMPIDSVGAGERDKAKRVCYGLMYGMGAASLSSQLDVSLEEVAPCVAASSDTSYPSSER